MNDRPPKWQTLLADLKRRRVFRVAAVYGGVAFAVLEASDLLAGGLGLPQQVVTIVTLIVLAGFPVAVIMAWTFDVSPAGVQRTAAAPRAELEAIAQQPRRRRWPAGIAALLGLFLFFAATWIAAGKLGWRPAALQSAYAVDDPRGSYVVLPFAHRAETVAEAELAEQAAARITRQLRGWETVRVVPDFALTGVMYDLGVSGPTLPTIDLGIELARSQRVGTLIALTAEVDEDSAFVEALLYDAADGTAVGRPVVARGLVDELDHLVAPVTQNVLDLRDLPAELETLRSESPNPRAHREFQDGLDALYGWRLSAAEEHFREAVASDSMFALPHHYLALTLYWQTSRNPERIVDLGPEIARLSRLAERLAEERNLRAGLQEHVRAFRTFWEGDYAGARTAYEAILARDSTDTEAWLLLGAVEITDPWLISTEGAAARPRSNLNLARRAFETTARLSPDFQLSYGSLFDLDRKIADAALGRGCPAYERPGGAPLPPYAVREAGAQEAFCPVDRDSIQWVGQGEVSSSDGERARLGAARTEAYLKRWASIQPDQPRPQEELADQLLWRQSLLRCDANPAEEEELAREALQRITRSLTLRGDTTPEDRFRLAVLSLAAGDPVAAVALADVALADLRIEDTEEDATALAPRAAANVFLATGRPRKAAELLAPGWSLASFAAEDPSDGSLVFAGPVGEPIGWLRVWGAAGVAGEEIGRAFDELVTEWGGGGYTDRQATLLRHAALQSMGLAPALALDAEARTGWFAGWAEQDLPIADVWLGLLAADQGRPEEAEQWLGRVVAEQERSRTRPTEYYLTGVLAAAVGADSLALAAFQVAAQCPASIGLLDDGWGLRPLSFYRAARAAERVGSDGLAADLYEAVLGLWSDAEPPLSFSADTAQEALSRLR
jgi:tetratricopeptide (TPR) repeat protein